MGDMVMRSGEAQAAEHPWGRIAWLLDGDSAPPAGLTIGYVEIEAGQKNQLHSHSNCEEVLYLLEGELDHSVGDELVRLRPGDALRVPRGVQHDARSVGAATARMLVMYDDPHRDFTVHAE